MKFERQNTIEGREIYENMGFKTTDSEIRNPDGSIVFSAKTIEIPVDWSQVAADVLAQKYFRKAGVPKILKKVLKKLLKKIIFLFLKYLMQNLKLKMVQF